MKSHGHVIPNPDGMRARCGGPLMCGTCAREQAALVAELQRAWREEAPRWVLAQRWLASRKTQFPHLAALAEVICQSLDKQRT